MYTEFIGNPTGKVFLATSRDSKFLLSHKGNASNVSNNSNESKISNVVINSINLMQITSPIPSDPFHPTYNAIKRHPSRVFSYNKNDIKELCKRNKFHRPSSNEEGTWRPNK